MSVVPRQQRGVAAVIAILIVALATSAAAYMLWAQSMGLRYVENLGARAQADELARAGAFLAGGLLVEDRTRDQRANKIIDHLGETWATSLPPFPAENATMTGRMEDEMAKFNLNNLATAGTPPAGAGPAPGVPDPSGQQGQPGQPRPEGSGNPPEAKEQAALAAFKRLLVALQLNEELAATLVDWIDPDDEISTGGAENLHYLGLDPPYRAANQKLSDLSELKRVKGFTEEVIQKLAPYVTVLPTSGTRINVNTASAQVLQYVLGISAGAARQIVETRKREPYENLQKIKEMLQPELAAAVDAQADVKSTFFSARATVVQGRVTVSYRALLDREAPGWPRIISMYGEPL